LPTPQLLGTTDEFSDISSTDTMNTVISGPCAVSCGYSFILFLIVTCTMHGLGSSGRIGNILVNYRCVAPKDKSFAQGLALVLVSLLAFIPGPIIYGTIIDSTCLVWNEACGKRRNCWLYHKEDFRLKLNITAAVFTTVGVLLDIVVLRLGRRLGLYEETNTRVMTSSKNDYFKPLKR